MVAACYALEKLELTAIGLTDDEADALAEALCGSTLQDY